MSRDQEGRERVASSGISAGGEGGRNRAEETRVERSEGEGGIVAGDLIWGVELIEPLFRGGEAPSAGQAEGYGSIEGYGSLEKCGADRGRNMAGPDTDCLLKIPDLACGMNIPCGGGAAWSGVYTDEDCGKLKDPTIKYKCPVRGQRLRTGATGRRCLVLQ